MNVPEVLLGKFCIYNGYAAKINGVTFEEQKEPDLTIYILSERRLVFHVKEKEIKLLK